MKLFIKLFFVILTALTVSIWGSTLPTQSATARTQLLKGAEAVSFLAEEGILEQIEDDIPAPPPPQGRFFLEPQPLTATDAGQYDWLGYAVALDGDTLLVGADGADISGKENQGAAYVFIRENGQWTQQQKLVAADGKTGDHFGYAVAVDGDTALISAHEADVAGEYDVGAVYIFTRSGSVWSQQDKLLPYFPNQYKGFGCALDLDGERAAVGACEAEIYKNSPHGGVFLYEHLEGKWIDTATIYDKEGEGWDEFGVSVALDGDTLLVGAPGKKIDQETMQGAVFIFAFNSPVWSQQKMLTASDGQEDNYFGTSVALDGQTALVGAYGADVGGSEWQGAAYVYTGSGPSWSEQQKLTANDGSEQDRFGVSVALQGDTALIGAMWATFGDEDHGAAYIFTRSAGNWQQQQKFAASDGQKNDYFGRSVALDQDTAVIGAWGADVGDLSAAGKVYVTERGRVPWLPQGSNTANDGKKEDSFGGSVDLDGDTAVVGAEFAQNQGGYGGAVYIFKHNAPIWVQESKLIAPDNKDAGLGFAASVAIDGDTVFVGADRGGKDWQGAAYFFTRSGSSWTFQQKISASDGVNGDNFGSSVDIDGDTAVIGAFLANVDGRKSQGAAYVFTRSAGVWSQQKKLIASDGAAGDWFGDSVAVDGDTIVIGADFADVENKESAGKAYVFTRSGTDWSEQKKLAASDPTAYAYFGFDAAVQGNTILVSAWGADIGTQIRQGAVYVFNREGLTWSEKQKLVAPDGRANDWLGYSVSLNEDTAVFGAPTKEIGGFWQGAAYVFTRSDTTWSLQQKIVAVDGQYAESFGSAVGLYGNSAIVGAEFADIDGQESQGRVNFYERQKLAQVIEFPEPAGGQVGQTIPLLATATSGLPIIYISDTPTICRITGNVAGLIAVGDCMVTAIQSGDATYAAAANVNNTFPVWSAYILLPFQEAGPGSGWQAGVQVQNMGESQTLIGYKGIDANGTLTDCGSVSTLPGGSANFLTFWSCPSGHPLFTSGLVSADLPGAAISSISNSPTGTAGGQYRGTEILNSAKSIFFPLVKHNHAQRTTSFSVQNASWDFNEITAFFKVNGITYSKVYKSVPPFVSVLITLADAGVPSGNGQVGSLSITGTQPLAGASMEYENGVAVTQNLQTAAAFTAADTDTVLYCPLFRNDHAAKHQTSGLQVQNVDTKIQEVTMTFTPVGGGAQVIKSQLVQPGASATFYAPTADIPPGTVGSVVVQGEGYIIAVVNENGTEASGQRLMTTYQCFPASSATPEVLIPLYKEFYKGNTSGIQVQNVAGDGRSATIEITYRATNSSAEVVFVPTTTIPDGESITFWGVSNLSSPPGLSVVSGTPAALAGTYGSVSITSDTAIVAIANETSTGTNGSGQDSKNYEGFNR